MSSATSASRNGSPTTASDGQIAFQLRRSRHQIERRLHRQLAELVGGEGINRGLELDIGLDIGLQTESGRALPAVAQAHRQRIAGAQIAAPDADQQRVAQGRMLRRSNQTSSLAPLLASTVVKFDSLRLVELRLAHVGRRPPRDLQHAGVVDAEGAGRIDQRQFGKRAGDERPAGVELIDPI